MELLAWGCEDGLVWLMTTSLSLRSRPACAWAKSRHFAGQTSISTKPSSAYARSYTGGELEHTQEPRATRRRSDLRCGELLRLLAGASPPSPRYCGHARLPRVGARAVTNSSHRSNLLRCELYPAMREGGCSSSWAYPGTADFPQLPTHLREARTGERRPDHLALTPPRPFLAEGDHRHLRPLGTRRTEAPSRQVGRRIPGLTVGPRTPPVPSGTSRL